MPEQRKRWLPASAASPATCDVTDETAVLAAIAQSREAHGPLRIVVHCAGIGTAGRIVGRNGPMPQRDFERVIGINLFGTFNVMRLTAHAMSLTEPAGEERGVFIATASVAAYEGQLGQAAYAAAKGGIVLARTAGGARVCAFRHSRDGDRAGIFRDAADGRITAGGRANARVSDPVSGALWASRKSSPISHSPSSATPRSTARRFVLTGHCVYHRSKGSALPVREGSTVMSEPTDAQIARHLRRANEVSERATTLGRHPFGALLVAPDHETILMEQCNVSMVEHAESTLARTAVLNFTPAYLWQCTLYSNIEPCAMCAGTIYWANIGRVAFALTEKRLLLITGANHPEMLTLAVSCRTIFAHGQKPIVTLGPSFRSRSRHDRDTYRLLEAPLGRV